MDQSTVKAFASLFRGFEKKSGRFEEEKPVDGKPKVPGRAKTVDGPVTEADFARHLAGNAPSVGVVPLREDDTVVFGALDVDVYDLDLEALAKKIKDTPLFLTKSKSKGAHLWLFSNEGIPAKDMIAALQNYAGQLGFGGCEIFPKQSTRGGPEDVGNWINLPYFGNTRTCLMYSSKQDQVLELTVEQFVELVSKYDKASSREILEHSQLGKTRKKRSKDAKLFEDGPPCNVSALLRHAAGELDLEGGRNNLMFNIGVYLCRRLESMEEVETILTQLNRGLFILEHKGEMIKIPPIGLPDKELTNTVIKSLQKKDYNYRCKEQPMCNLCQRSKCRTRTFGVDKNRADMDFDLGALTKVLAETPYYYLSVGDKRVKFKDTNELTTQKSFRTKICEAVNHMMPPMSEPEFASMINVLMDDTVRIDVLPIQDVNDITDILLALDTYIKEYKTDRIEDIRNQRVFHDHEKQRFVFQLTHFQNYLKRNKINYERQFLADELAKQVGMTMTEDLGQRLGQVNILSQSIPMSAFDVENRSELDVPSTADELEEKEFGI